MSPDPPAARDEQKPMLPDQARCANCSIHTEAADLQWIRRFMTFHNKRHLREMGTDEVNAFLSHPVVVDQVAASTQNQTVCAFLFLYKEGLKQEPCRLERVAKAKKPRKPPVVFSAEQVQAVRVPLQPMAIEYRLKTTTRNGPADGWPAVRLLAEAHEMRTLASQGVEFEHRRLLMGTKKAESID